MALENLQAALNAEGLQSEITLVNIESADDAEAHQFLGSPSIRVDVDDLWPE